MGYQFRSRRAAEMLARDRRRRDRIVCWGIIALAVLANVLVGWYFWPQIAARL